MTSQSTGEWSFAVAHANLLTDAGLILTGHLRAVLEGRIAPEASAEAMTRQLTTIMSQVLGIAEIYDFDVEALLHAARFGK